MPYHVRITPKSDRSHDEVKLDLTKDQLTEKFLKPYTEGRSIVIGGKNIPPNDIERIRISFTEKTSDVLLPQVRAKRMASRFVVIGISDEWYVADEGQDVTDNFITGPPGSDISKIDQENENISEKESSIPSTQIIADTINIVEDGRHSIIGSDITSSSEPNNRNWKKIGVIIAAVTLLLAFITWNWPEPPWKQKGSENLTTTETNIEKLLSIHIEKVRVEVYSRKISPYIGTLLQFRITNLGSVNDNTIPPLNLFYLRNNQTFSSCAEGIYFFNDLKPLCFLRFKEKEEEKVCGQNSPSISPSENYVLEQSLDEEAYSLVHSLNSINLTRDCEIREVISICSEFNKKRICSQPREVIINYKYQS